MVGLDNTFIGGSNGFKRSEHFQNVRFIQNMYNKFFLFKVIL